MRWGLGLGPGNEISEVNDGSVAEESGVYKGTFLLKVNDLPVLPNPNEGLTAEQCLHRIEEALGQLEVKLTLLPKVCLLCLLACMCAYKCVCGVHACACVCVCVLVHAFFFFPLRGSLSTCTLCSIASP